MSFGDYHPGVDSAVTTTTAEMGAKLNESTQVSATGGDALLTSGNPPVSFISQGIPGVDGSIPCCPFHPIREEEEELR